MPSKDVPILFFPVYECFPWIFLLLLVQTLSFVDVSGPQNNPSKKMKEMRGVEKPTSKIFVLYLRREIGGNPGGGVTCWAVK